MVRVLPPPDSSQTSPQPSSQHAVPASATPPSKRPPPSPLGSTPAVKRAKSSSERAPSSSPSSTEKQAQPAAKHTSSSRPSTSANRAKPIDAGDMLKRPPAPSSYKVLSEHSSFDDANISLQLLEDGVHYTVKSNSGKGGRSKLYICRRHQLCGRHARIRRVDCAYEGQEKYILEVGGDHRGSDDSSKDSTTDASTDSSANSPDNSPTNSPEKFISSSKRRGILPAHKAEVDARSLGAGPVKIRAEMQQKYAGQEKLLKALPTEEQIKYRKQQLTKEREKAVRIHSHAEVVEWCGLWLCTLVREFFVVGEFDRLTDEARLATLVAGSKNATLVFDCFRHDVVIDGKTVECIGVIFSSRRLFRNVFYAFEGQQADGIFAAADGTYKIHRGNWVLVAFGSYRSRFTDRRVYSKNFVPWAYMFVRTEHQYAYEELFRTVVKYAKKFFDIDLKVRFGSLDHPASITNAYKAVWPDITLLDCYPHVARKCREKIGLLNDYRYYDASIATNITQLHLARSPEQFSAMTKLCLQRWRDDEETEYADWFEKIYLPEQWERWYTASAIPGISPSQNALESHNGVVKKLIQLRASTGVVLNDSIPKIFEKMGCDAPKGPFGHWCEGPIPSAMIHKAALHIRQKTAHYIKYQYAQHKRRVRSIFFNASDFMDTPARAHVQVTLERVKRYLASKNGILGDGVSVNEIPLLFQSLHEVEIIGTNEQLAAFKLECIPLINSDKIKEIRELFRCDCKAFWSTGWACSHVIAAAAVLDKFNLENAVTGLPITKVSGGQRKIPGALYVDDPTNKTLSKSTLMKTLLTKPLAPKGMWVAADFSYFEDWVETVSYMTGRVGNPEQVDGVYSWTVKYEDGTVEAYECEELVDLIVSSRRLGVDVTSAELPSLEELIAARDGLPVPTDLPVAESPPSPP